MCADPHAQGGHFNQNSPEQVALLKDALLKCEIHAVSMHASFNDILDISGDSSDNRRQAIENIKSSIDLLSEVGGEFVVIHLSNRMENGNENRMERYARECLQELKEYCSAKNEKLVVENSIPGQYGWRISEIENVLNGLDPQVVGLCLDTSHANLGEGAVRFVNSFGSRIWHLHISDNLGHEDDHFVPGDGNINWEKLRESLIRVGYSGTIMGEVFDKKAEDPVRILARTREKLEEFSW